MRLVPELIADAMYLGPKFVTKTVHPPVKVVHSRVKAAHPPVKAVHLPAKLGPGGRKCLLHLVPESDNLQLDAGDPCRQFP